MNTDHVIDLRSDTVTAPTTAMRSAMAAAQVGDDQFGEDPTVNRLQELAAAKLGKEAALFVPSGLMGNLASVLAHCQRGEEVILGDQSHCFQLEAGSVAVLGGLQTYQVRNQPDGTMPLEEIRRAIRADNVHFPISRLIMLENTHNRCGGAVLSAEYTRQVGALAKEHGLRLHIDGARIFNAAAALGVSAAELAQSADSITFCLSKGLCAPVGSLICGTAEFIKKARRARKLLGGSMRQSGVLAAAGIVALEQMVDRLAEDHRRARALAEKLQHVPGLRLKYGLPVTNMIFLNLEGAAQGQAPAIGAKLQQQQIRIHVVDANTIRLVTHYWISDADIETAARAFARALSA